MKTPRKPYSQRSDTERLESNWTKTLGLFDRGEYSMAIVRAGTCAEIAANIVIRAELVHKRHLEQAFVDSLLIWANGLSGKFTRIILPLFEGNPRRANFIRHHEQIREVNDARNKIAHGGRFAKKESAEKLIRVAHSVCTSLTAHYPPHPKLEKL
jgi:hypothetical protein